MNLFKTLRLFILSVAIGLVWGSLAVTHNPIWITLTFIVLAVAALWLTEHETLRKAWVFMAVSTLVCLLIMYFEPMQIVSSPHTLFPVLAMLIVLVTREQVK